MNPHRRRRLTLFASLAAALACVLLHDSRVSSQRLHPCRREPHGVAIEYGACFVEVPGGTFLMGAQATDRSAPGFDPLAQPDEAPPHTVTLPTFWLASTETPVRDFHACVAAGACDAREFIGSGGQFNYSAKVELRPMNGVTWTGAQEFCHWLGGRLPTEAEWEFAARGTEGRRYPWGDAEADCHHAIMQVAGQSAGCGADGTQRVWTEPASSEHPLGFRQLAGNVWEWTADWYDDAYYARAPGVAPTGPSEGTRRVQRGGSFGSSDPGELRGAFRAGLPPDLRQPDTGFRCAADNGDVAKRWLPLGDWAVALYKRLHREDHAEAAARTSRR